MKTGKWLLKEIDAYTEFHDWKKGREHVLPTENKHIVLKKMQWVLVIAMLVFDGTFGSFFRFPVVWVGKKKTKVYISDSATSLFYFIEREKQN